MKHYIYLEKQKVTYVYGGYRPQGPSGTLGKFQVEKMATERLGLEIGEAFGSLVKARQLAGKKVTLVLDCDLSAMVMALPRSGRSAARRMALNELVTEGRWGGDCGAGVDLYRGRGEGRLRAIVYYMKKGRLEEYKNAVTGAGMVCRRILAAPHCMAVMAQEIWKERFLLVIDVEEEQLGLYLVSGGHCLASRITSLKAQRFCRLGREELLYEEMGEQARAVIKMGFEYEGFGTPECVILTGDCPVSPDKAAEFLEEDLDIPCFVRKPGQIINSAGEPAEAQNVPTGILAACATKRSLGKGKPVEIRGGDALGPAHCLWGIRSFISGGWILFLVINAAALAWAGIHIGLMQNKAANELYALQEFMNEPDYKERSREIRRIEGELAKAAERKADYQMVQENAAGENLLNMEAFRAFTNAMEDDMEIESMTFEGSRGSLQMVISMSSKTQIPPYVQRVKDAALFSRVSHSLWEQRKRDEEEARYYTVIHASLEGGEQNEIQ